MISTKTKIGTGLSTNDEFDNNHELVLDIFNELGYSLYQMHPEGLLKVNDFVHAESTNYIISKYHAKGLFTSYLDKDEIKGFLPHENSFCSENCRRSRF